MDARRAAVFSDGAVMFRGRAHNTRTRHMLLVVCTIYLSPRLCVVRKTGCGHCRRHVLCTTLFASTRGNIICKRPTTCLVCQQNTPSERPTRQHARIQSRVHLPPKPSSHINSKHARHAGQLHLTYVFCCRRRCARHVKRVACHRSSSSYRVSRRRQQKTSSCKRPKRACVCCEHAL